MSGFHSCSREGPPICGDGDVIENNSLFTGNSLFLNCTLLHLEPVFKKKFLDLKLFNLK